MANNCKFEIQELKQIIFDYLNSCGKNKPFKLKYSALVKYAKDIKGIENIIDKDFSRKKEIREVISKYNANNTITELVNNLKEKPSVKFLISSSKAKVMDDKELSTYIEMFNSVQKKLVKDKAKDKAKIAELEKELKKIQRKNQALGEVLVDKNKELNRNNKELNRVKEVNEAYERGNFTELRVKELENTINSCEKENKELKKYLKKAEHLQRFEYISKLAYSDKLANYTYKDFTDSLLDVKRNVESIGFDNDKKALLDNIDVYVDESINSIDDDENISYISIEDFMKS